MLLVNKIMVPVDITMMHFDIIYLACRRQKYATTQQKRPLLSLDIFTIMRLDEILINTLNMS